ncbi:uncharacterized protein THITE_2111580 [Thermothielavioides terrestris NRRL 8126]|uniref:Myb-like domain-containing protein n=1 Tax=Thermothielavioides terrestris (strain ATCC 38088 / NRRL 8126) TaxID=578455 RepID=G2R2T1_THETT|nr:uncharacterized protein THITE_2111580 [Thermothielavioides terrestris NRRL 8126]AEO65042.1 hypothetical protein THITE_2111580 [Thermothielavioides terrestris NRRL 8126]
MSGRGRARPASRSAPESSAGPGRRSTRHHQQQELQEQAPEEERPAQLEVPMSTPDYHDDIDPAITGPQDGSMPPPPLPSAKGLRGQDGPIVARRGTRRDPQASSIASVNSMAVTDAFSQAEPQGSASQRTITAHLFGTAGPAASAASSEGDSAPSRNLDRVRRMEQMLPRLFAASENLFSHLCSDQGDAEIWEIDRIGFRGAFAAYLAHYPPVSGNGVGNGNPVIDLARVANDMQIDQASLSWKPIFRTILAANLASLLDDITPIDRQDLLPVLQKWDSHFLDGIVGDDLSNWDVEMKKKIIEQVLMIRIQLSIFTLQSLQRSSHTPFHPYEQIARIWCTGDVSAEAVESFLGDDQDALQLRPVMRADPADAELEKIARDAATLRFTSLCRMLPNEVVVGFDHDISDIHETTYTIGEFEDGLRGFARLCFAENKAAMQQGPSNGRHASLPFAPSDASSRADSQIRSQLESDALAHQFSQVESSAHPQSFDPEGMAMLKRLGHPGPAGYGDGQLLPPHPQRPAPYPPDIGGAPSVEYTGLSLQGGFPPNGTTYGEAAAQTPGSRKRRAPAGPAATGDGAAGSAAPAAKKPRARRRKSDIPVAGAAAALASTATPPSAPTAPAPAAPAPMQPSQYPPLPGSDDEPDLEALAQRTREISAAARKVKQPQVRSAWVRKDVSLLIKAVHAFQCKWSTIEKEIKAGTLKFERNVNQQALRDKARLLKQDFLKADAVLPRGFDLVVLGKKEKEAVIACGKNPFRKEADIDENGRPINTEYNPAAEGAPEVEPQPEAQQEGL